jgi:poly(3-hydroxybutyrate) depolymerase
MKHLIPALALIFTNVVAAAPAGPLNIDPERITVSGISSGAHMAQQLHVAYSDLFSGAAILAGGPYGCAENSLVTAMSRCVKKSDDPLPVAPLIENAREAAAQGHIADLANLADDRVWLFHGTQDDAVAAEVHAAAGTFYAAFITAEQIEAVNDIPAGHVFPADGRGNGCSELVPPFVGDCGFDAAGELLGFLYPGVSEPEAGVPDGLHEVTLPGAGAANLLETAYLFVPPACAAGEDRCGLHVVLHGCAQSAEELGTAFIEMSGYLPWAAANRIVLAFPQVEKSLVAPVNPLGCWDWWGYTGEDYLWRSGAQMRVITGWIGELTGHLNAAR